MENISTVNSISETRQERTDSLVWSTSERWFVGLTIVFVLIVTSMPYFFGYMSTPPDKQFMGIMLDVPDHAQYFSWMRELSTANLASDKMTPEPNRPIFFNLLWWGMGRLSLLLGVGYAVMFQFLRVLATILFLLLAYRLCKWFLKDRWMAQTAFLLITFTSGLGWILVVLKYITKGDIAFPLDLYVAEGNTFLGMLGYPHFIAALLYVFVFDLVLRGRRKKQLRYALVAGLVALFLGWQHTYDLVSVYGVLGAFTFLLWLRDRRLPWLMIKSDLIIGFLSCSPAIYSVLLTSLDPVWKGVLGQFSNAGVFTPGPLHLIILYGFIFLLAIASLIVEAIQSRGARQFLNNQDDNNLFLKGWFLVTFLLIYLPVDYQIHLLNGWQIPMAILATIGLFRYIIPVFENKLLPMIKINRLVKLNPVWIQRFFVMALLVLVVPTNIYLWVWRFTDLSKHDYPYYLLNEEVAGMNWLDRHANPDNVVLSSLTIGQYIPAMTGTHAYLAHWAETLDFFAKSKQVDSFFSAGTNDTTREQLLKAGKINYVFWGPAEKAMGDTSLDQMPGLTPVYSSPQVIIFQVNP